MKYIYLATVLLLFTGCSAQEAQEVNNSIAGALWFIIVGMAYVVMACVVFVLTSIVMKLLDKEYKLLSSTLFLSSVFIIAFWHVIQFAMQIPQWWTLVMYTLGLGSI